MNLSQPSAKHLKLLFRLISLVFGILFFSFLKRETDGAWIGVTTPIALKTESLSSLESSQPMISTTTINNNAKSGRPLIHEHGFSKGKIETKSLEISQTESGPRHFKKHETIARGGLRNSSKVKPPLTPVTSPDKWQDLRKVAIKKQRVAIGNEMKGYNFSELDGELTRTNGTVVDDLIMEKGGNPIRNVIFATWRSGSTFMGSLLDSHPGMLHEYEPLVHFNQVQVRNGMLAEEALKVLNGIFSCNHTLIPNLDTFLKRYKDRSFFIRRISGYCGEGFKRVCEDATFLSDMCKLFPFQSMKTVRMRLRLGKALLENKRFNLRLLLLVRDPRAIMQSRQHRKWCLTGPDCHDVRRLCMDMEDDYRYAEIFRRQYPDQFLALRYEDISLGPLAAARKIFKFFRLQFHPQVEKFLQQHTSMNSKGYRNPNDVSIQRESKKMVFHWMYDLYGGNFSRVAEIQNSCSKAMAEWGYSQVLNRSQLLSFMPLLSPPWPEMIVSVNGSNY